MISESVLNFLMEIGVLSFVIPVGVLLAWRIRTKKNFKPAVAGVLGYIGFGLLLRRVFDTFFLYTRNPVSQVLNANNVLYYLYWGLVAAIFEEIGRYLVYKYFMREEKDRFVAISYGIGAGAVEMICVTGLTDLSYYIFANVYNENPKGIKEQALIDTLKSLNTTDLVISGLMQLFFFGLQICLSVLVLEAYRNVAERKRYMVIAMVTHMISFLPAGCHGQKYISHIMAAVLLFIILAFAFFLARGVYLGMRKNDLNLAKEEKKQAKLNGKQDNFSFAKQKFTNIDTDKNKKKDDTV